MKNFTFFVIGVIEGDNDVCSGQPTLSYKKT